MTLPDRVAAELPAWIWPLVAAAIVASTAVIPYVRTQRRRTIFISYRRKDSGAYVGRIFDRLKERFGAGVWRDLVSIKPGENFHQAIARTLRNCDAALVLIGPDWVTIRDERGAPRLHDPEDLVRQEVALALSSGAMVVPVLLDGAPMPAAADLPTDMGGLTDLQAVSIADQTFEPSLSTLAHAIAGASVRQTPLLLLIPHVAVLVLLIVFFRAGGMTRQEFTTSLGIVAPMLAAVGTVSVTHASGHTAPLARIRQVRVAALAIPLCFLGAIALLVVCKSLNAGITSPETFQLSLGAVELLFSGYSGHALASLWDDRRLS